MGRRVRGNATGGTCGPAVITVLVGGGGGRGMTGKIKHGKGAKALSQKNAD